MQKISRRDFLRGSAAAMLLASLNVSTGLAEESSDTWIADRTISIQVFVDDIGNTLPDEWSNTLVGQRIKELTGITLDINYTPSDSDSTMLSSMLAAGTIPDVIVSYLNNSTRKEFPLLYKAASEEMFADISSYIPDSQVFSKYLEDGYLPTDTYNNIVFREDFNGAVYLIHLGIEEVDRSLEYDPTNEYVGGMYIRKDIAEALGIDVTAINTMDEFYDLLVAIKDGGFTDDNGNAVYPLGPKYWGGSSDALQYIMTGYDWGVSDNYNFTEDGELKHVAETDHVYDGLNFIRKLLDEDLMNPEFFTMDSTRAEEVSRIGNSAIIADVHNYEDIIYGSDTYIPLGPLNDITGENSEVVTGKSGYGCLAISSGADNPEEIFNFFDWLCTPEAQKLVEYGIEGVSYELNDEGYPRLTDEAQEAVDNGDTSYMINNVGAAFGGSGVYFYEMVTTNTNAIDNFGESRPGASSENTAYARAVEIATDYPVEKRLVTGLDATAFLSADELANVKIQLDLLDWDESFVQACFADSDEEAQGVIENFCAQIQAAGVEQFEDYVEALEAETPGTVFYYN